MERKLAKYAASLVVTGGVAIALPAFAPVAAPIVTALMAGILSEETVRNLGKAGVGAITGVMGNLASSVIWESGNPLSRNPENNELLQLLANAYLEALNEFEATDQSQAERILPLVCERLKTAIDANTDDDLLKLFPLDKNSKQGDLKYSFVNRISSGDVILEIADESFSEIKLFADEIEVSIRRWYNEGKTAEAQEQTKYTMIGLSNMPLPENLRVELREQLSKSIPKKIGELIKTKGFEKSWIAFQRSYLQAILKEIKNEKNRLTDEDRKLLKPLAENLDKLAKLEDIPEKLAVLSQKCLSRFDDLEKIIKDNQAELLGVVKSSEERIVREVKNQSDEIKKKIEKGNVSLKEIKSELANVKSKIESLSRDYVSAEIINSLINEVKALAEKVNSGEKPLPDNIPPPNENFVGREKYLKILREEYGKNARCFVLHGIGGVGKSELAKQFLSEIAGEYEAKVFVEMLGMSENPYSAERVMSEIVRQFEPKTDVNIPFEQLKNLYLQKVQQQPTLVFLDNAENKRAVEDLKQARACFVVTSRETFTLTDKQGGKHINQMSEEDARELLFEFAGKENFSDEEADRLARLAGYLPMALRPLAAILAEDDFETAEDLIKTYADAQKLLETKVPDYYDRTIAASFELSYQKLSEEMQNRWLRLAVFPSDFDIEAMAAVLEISAEEADETQRHLRRRSLLEGNPETRRFSLHDLMREFTRRKLSAEELFQTEFLFACHFASIILRAQKMQENKEENYFVNGLKLLDVEWDNITAGQKWAADNIDNKNNSIAETCTIYCRFARDQIKLRLHPRQNLAWLKDGLKASQKIDNLKAQSDCLISLGNAYRALGDYDNAIFYHKQNLEISRKNKDRKAESSDLTNIGNVYVSKGDNNTAIFCYELSLLKYPTYIAKLNLGRAYGKIGNIPVAISLINEAKEYYRRNGQLDREGSCLLALGEIYIVLNPREGIVYLKKSLAISREIGDRSREGGSLGSLGDAYFRLGEKEKACDLWKESLAIFEAIGLPDAEIVRQNIEKYC